MRASCIATSHTHKKKSVHGLIGFGSRARQCADGGGFTHELTSHILYIYVENVDYVLHAARAQNVYNLLRLCCACLRECGFLGVVFFQRANVCRAHVMCRRWLVFAQ